MLANLEFLGVDYLVPAGGDDTLSYGVELGRRGFPVVALPKTMDNDVPGTDYCMGFGTCVSRTVQLARQVTSSAASHERIVVLEVFGRYAGFSALLPTFAGAAQRCLIPEHEFDVALLAELLVADREVRHFRGRQNLRTASDDHVDLGAAQVERCRRRQGGAAAGQGQRGDTSASQGADIHGDRFRPSEGERGIRSP